MLFIYKKSKNTLREFTLAAFSFYGKQTCNRINVFRLFHDWLSNTNGKIIWYCVVCSYKMCRALCPIMKTENLSLLF